MQIAERKFKELIFAAIKLEPCSNFHRAFGQETHSARMPCWALWKISAFQGTILLTG
jgi:hypothetical protein